MRVGRRRVEVVLVRGAQGPVPMLLQLDERALRHRRRIVRLMRRRWADVRLARHRRRPGGILRRAPERGAQVREVQRREAFVLHFCEIATWILGSVRFFSVIRASGTGST